MTTRILPRRATAAPRMGFRPCPGPLFEKMDDAIKNWARRLVLERKADFLGTDAHRTYHRPPSVEMGLKWLYKNTDPEYADAISRGNAQGLLTQK